MNKVDEIMALVQQLGTSEHNQDDGQALYFENEIRKAIEAIAQPVVAHHRTRVRKSSR